MDKTAQRRGLLNKLHEKVNIGGKALEAFSDEFKELMDNLREVDDHIRIEAAKLKDYVKAAKTNFNRREYMTTIFYLGNFHDRVEAIDRELSKLGSQVDVKHHEFLFGDMDSEHRDYLTDHFNPKIEGLKNKTKRASLDERAVLEKEAGISDWWHNITTDRGKTLGSWEKRFPKYSKELKKQTSNMIAKSESYLQTLLFTLKKLASLRAGRKLEEYLKETEKLQSKYRLFNSQFVDYYQNHVKKLVDMQKILQNSEEQTEEATQDEIINPMMEQIQQDMPSLPVEQAPALEEGLPGLPSKPVEHTRESFPMPGSNKIPSEVVGPPTPGPVPSWPKIQSDPFPAIEYAKTTPAPNFAPAPETQRSLDLVNPVIPQPGRLPQDLMNSSHPPLTEVDEAPPTFSTSPSGLPTNRDLPKYKNQETPATMVSKYRHAAYKVFLIKLAKLEEAHPLVMAKEIIQYANSIEDLELKDKLLNIARNLLK